MGSFGAEQYLCLTRSIGRDVNHILIPAAVAASLQRPGRVHGCVIGSSAWKRPIAACQLGFRMGGVWGALRMVLVT